MDENIRDEVLTIGTGSTKIALPLLQGQRTAFTVINTSTAGQTVSLHWGGEATAGEGIVIFPGGNWSESEDQVFKPSIKEVWAVADAAAATISIHERVRG